ncbi:MAG: peptide ABC transporter substrate-binding protein [Oscillibacter sp.]|nr:peptide ABC transporter substrate-binding protein [Oscillibacter sp.]
MRSIEKKCGSLLCALLALLLCACGGTPDHTETPPPEEETGPYTLRVRVSEAQNTLAPASVTAAGGETILYHLFENLLRWEDGGDGWAVLANGQAEGYTVETDYAGNATYTFTLREDIVWSDGKPVTAEDFVNAWQRLADPVNELPYRHLMSAVSGYGEVQEDGTPAPLGVSAPDSRTLVVALNGSPAWFLEEVCAGAYTMPVRADLVSQTSGAVTNGAYTAASRTAQLVTLERSETYYDPDPKGPEVIEFAAVSDSQGDYDALLAGEAALVIDLPGEPLRALADSGLWTPEPVTETYGVLLNTRKAPFDNENVRLAFHLAVDRQAVVDALGDLTARPALGIVPYGVADYSERPVEEEEIPEETLPDPNAVPEPEEPAAVCWDFRTHGLEVVTAEHVHDYETDRSYAQALLANAGYPGGSGFPEAEYLYVNGSDADAAVARTLQGMWKECLGVSISIRGVSQEEYDAALSPALPDEEDGESAGSEEEASDIPAFTMAAQGLRPVYSDAEILLNRWHSTSEHNASGYASGAFDILLDAAGDVVSPDARDAYLHDAEAILLDDSPVIPVFCRGGSFQLAEGLTGLYRSPNQVFFLYNVHRESAGN